MMTNSYSLAMSSSEPNTLEPPNGQHARRRRRTRRLLTWGFALALVGVGVPAAALVDSDDKAKAKCLTKCTKRTAPKEKAACAKKCTHNKQGPSTGNAKKPAPPPPADDSSDEASCNDEGLASMSPDAEVICLDTNRADRELGDDELAKVTREIALREPARGDVGLVLLSIPNKVTKAFALGRNRKLGANGKVDLWIVAPRRSAVAFWADAGSKALWSTSRPHDRAALARVWRRVKLRRTGRGLSSPSKPWVLYRHQFEPVGAGVIKLNVAVKHPGKKTPQKFALRVYRPQRYLSAIHVSLINAVQLSSQPQYGVATMGTARTRVLTAQEAMPLDVELGIGVTPYIFRGRSADGCHDVGCIAPYVGIGVYSLTSTAPNVSKWFRSAWLGVDYELSSVFSLTLAGGLLRRAEKLNSLRIGGPVPANATASTVVQTGWTPAVALVLNFSPELLSQVAGATKAVTKL